MVLDVLNVDNFDFTRKIVKKNLGEKFVKMHKCLGFVKIEFLDKNLTFPIVFVKLRIVPIKEEIIFIIVALE